MNTTPRNRLFPVPEPTPPVPVLTEPRGSSVLTTVLVFAAMAMTAWFLLLEPSP